MPAKSPPFEYPETSVLLDLFRLIAGLDPVATMRALRTSPHMVQQPILEGATRQMTNTFFLQDISHYVYAGDTALHIAAAAYQVTIVKELLALGANPSAQNRLGAQPIHYASDGNPGAKAWDPGSQSSIIHMLFVAGAALNSRDKNGVAPLHRAVRSRCSAAVETLLTHGADPLGLNKSGSTPLHLAVQNTGRSGSGSQQSHEEQVKIINLLLRYGAKGSDQDGAGKSVIQCVRADWIRTLLDQRQTR